MKDQNQSMKEFMNSFVAGSLGSTGYQGTQESNSAYKSQPAQQNQTRNAHVLGKQFTEPSSAGYEFDNGQGIRDLKSKESSSDFKHPGSAGYTMPVHMRKPSSIMGQSSNKSGSQERQWAKKQNRDLQSQEFPNQGSPYAGEGSPGSKERFPQSRERQFKDSVNSSARTGSEHVIEEVAKGKKQPRDSAFPTNYLEQSRKQYSQPVQEKLPSESNEEEKEQYNSQQQVISIESSDEWTESRKGTQGQEEKKEETVKSASEMQADRNRELIQQFIKQRTVNK